MIPLDEQQRLFLVESDQLYRAWLEAYRQARSYRYGMKWITRKGRQYLLRLHDAKGNGKSLGVRSAETEALWQAFQEGKARALERHRHLSEKLLRQARLNKAIRLGRLPSIVSDVLAGLQAHEVARDFCVVDTHAIFAYEALAGVHCRMELLASGDVDLLYDPRKPLALVSDKLDGSDLLGILRKVDKSFELLPGYEFRAANQQGFMVDLVILNREMHLSAPIRFAEEDLQAVEVPNLHWLVNAPKLEVVTINAQGVPVLMHVPDPRAFALHKAWLSQQTDREPVKKPRDQQQAILVAELTTRYLPHLPFAPEKLKYLSSLMLGTAAHVLEQHSDIRLPGLDF